MKPFYVYIIKCADGSYYTDYTNNFVDGFEQHVLGNAKSYTSSRKPFKLVFCSEFSEHRYAQEAEKKIKGWTRRKKQALIDENFVLLKKLAKKNLNS